jgi:hypothetical protein
MCFQTKKTSFIIATEYTTCCPDHSELLKIKALFRITTQNTTLMKMQSPRTLSTGILNEFG